MRLKSKRSEKSKKSKRNKIRCALLFGLLASSSSVYATGYPVLDTASVMELVKSAQQSVEQFKQSVKEWTNQLNASIQGQGKQIDTINNGFANSIARTNQAMNDVFNKDLEQQTQPSIDACATYSVSTALNDAMCTVLESVASAAETRAKNFLNSDSDISASAASQKNANAILEVANELHQAESPSRSGAEGDQQLSDQVLRADILLGSQGDTFDDNSMKATQAFNDILVGASIAAEPSIQNSDDQTNYVDNYLRPNAIRALAANSLDTVRSLRVGGDGTSNTPSVMQTMQQFVDSHFGTPDGDQWLRNITNTQDDAEDFMSDSAVLRSMTQMQAFQNYLTMMQYQSQLRQETLQAALLALKNKDIYGN
ncbi:hypothetical protein [Cysteiniphilum marinum]|uniref:hypothetical protein n=1 Tax=Cysteiniphilum marinum TaxID=2774191 RepID=UPI00193B1EEB|nr:hypothetical protein [Cysteiniphilum marinum]